MRIADEVLETVLADPALGHYRPWIEHVRKEKPHQLEDRIEQLFHEKSVTGQGAWNRLFDETIASLRFNVEGRELTLEPTLNLMQDKKSETRKLAAEALAQTLKGNLRTFALISSLGRPDTMCRICGSLRKSRKAFSSTRTSACSCALRALPSSQA